ncbi:hypothetical protein [Pontibacter burrus]|uniref:Lipoprotein n=1 Tax=Pontibacter burrus TaxID=2704466 RepID=A0A6B3LXJ0_9BACT|nr:hypothetical protein [Pontibacter burrus]NEM98134.1 hypothetical protein [Pontibacter burrus]
MLHTFKKLSIGLGAMLLMVSCSKDMEDVTPSAALNASATNAAKAALTTNPLTFSSIGSADGKTWSFTLQKAVDGNLGNVGALLLTLTDCDDTQIALSAANVVSATVTGATTQALVPSYKEGNGSACDMSAVTGYLRLSDFTEKLTDGKVYTVTVTLNQAVRVKSATVWARVSNTCSSTTIAGPACEVEDLCGEGQGYFHKSANWQGNTVTIGGHTYTAEEAVTLITSDKKEGGSNNKGGIADSKAAFAQGVTVLMNRKFGWISGNAYAAELAAIEAYLSTLDKLTTYDLSDLPTGNDAAKTAAGYIGDSIKCGDAE